MSDILTQIQDELDFLLNMMQRQIGHIVLHAPPSVPPGQHRVDTFDEIKAKTTSTDNTQSTKPAQPTADKISPEQFRQDIKEFATDIVIKQQQVEALIASLPGLNVSEEQQLARMKDLELEWEALEDERRQAVREKEMLLKRVEDKIMSVGRSR
ncbi:RNA polymerase II mediator complex subunit [Pleosporales sp. CAS-2024a]